MEAILTKIYGRVLAQVERSMPIFKVVYDIIVKYHNIFVIPFNHEGHNSNIRISD